MPKTSVAFFICVLAISGFPPLSGFFSKDEILSLVFANAPHRLYYVLAVITAGLTAFYMMRLYVYAFLGKTRCVQAHDIHEAPRSMTGVTTVLAILSCSAGFIGLPHNFAPSWIGHWLKALGKNIPHTADNSVLQNAHLMIISTTVSLACAALAYSLYRKDLNVFATVKRRFRPVYQLVSQRFKVDEFYDEAIVRPIKAFSLQVLYRLVDVQIIDGMLVNGLSSVSRFVGMSLSLLQTGLLGNYLLYLLLSVLAMLLYFLYA